MRYAWLAALALLPAVAYAGTTRAVVDLATVPSTHFTVTTDLGLAGGAAGRPYPLAWRKESATVFCDRTRRSAFESYGDDGGEVTQIVTIAGVEYLDKSQVSRDALGLLVVTEHTRQRVVRVVVDGGNVVVWAWRPDNARLEVGAFGDFGDPFRGQFGCGFLTTSMPLSGGMRRLESSPALANPRLAGFTNLVNTSRPDDPTFTLLTSVSRSSSDTGPLFTLRLTTP
jgi:hypothetical protein